MRAGENERRVSSPVMVVAVDPGRLPEKAALMGHPRWGGACVLDAGDSGAEGRGSGTAGQVQSLHQGGRSAWGWGDQRRGQQGYGVRVGLPLPAMQPGAGSTLEMAQPLCSRRFWSRADSGWEATPAALTGPSGR